MKFGKLLAVACEGNAQLSPLVLRYKKLKKLLKTVHAQQEQHMQAPPEETRPQGPLKLSPEHLDFMNILSEDLSRFNSYFIDKEEEAVIRMEALAEQVRELDSLNLHQLQVLRHSLVELHGELVLCLHWSLLNYAAILKILKKHDKLGSLQLKPMLQHIILHQPFSSTKIMQQLVVQAEQMTTQVAQQQQLLKRSGGQQQQEEAEQPHVTNPAESLGLATLVADSSVFRYTQQALEMWATMSNTASTPSTVLPTALLQNLRHNLTVVYAQTAAAAAAPAIAEANKRGVGRSLGSPLGKQSLKQLHARGPASNEADERPVKRPATQMQLSASAPNSPVSTNQAGPNSTETCVDVNVCSPQQANNCISARHSMEAVKEDTLGEAETAAPERQSVTGVESAATHAMNACRLEELSMGKHQACNQRQSSKLQTPPGCLLSPKQHEQQLGWGHVARL